MYFTHIVIFLATNNCFLHVVCMWVFFCKGNWGKDPPTTVIPFFFCQLWGKIPQRVESVINHWYYWSLSDICCWNIFFPILDSRSVWKWKEIRICNILLVHTFYHVRFKTNYCWKMVWKHHATTAITEQCFHLSSHRTNNIVSI